ncbi:hypothetical protein [Polaromonas sp.]|uniref:hypothetical protein n=1 Tax=Polaromonas sp. TaxID=1869339 RepID=UPI0018313719|nr:hypothetical protein [Polaromonas sp.]NMM05555.1 hypothetical protein [Polaromonas sp.]
MQLRAGLRATRLLSGFPEVALQQNFCYVFHSYLRPYLLGYSHFSCKNMTYRPPLQAVFAVRPCFRAKSAAVLRALIEAERHAPGVKQNPLTSFRQSLILRKPACTVWYETVAYLTRSTRLLK